MRKILAILILSKTIVQSSTVPLNLVCTDSSLSNTTLEWDIPDAFQLRTLTHFDGLLWNASGIGNGDGSDVAYFQRFTGPQLSEFHGKKIITLDFISRANATFQALVFEVAGLDNPDIANLSDCILSSPQIINPNQMEWTSASLFDYQSSNGLGDTTSVSTKTIDSTKSYVFGLIISDYVVNTYPMGIDMGPGINNFGDIVAFIGESPTNPSGYFLYTWQTLSGSNSDLDGNWAIKLNVVQNMTLTNYNIYEDFSLIQTISPTCFESSCSTETVSLGATSPGDYQYFVTSLYDNGETESGSSNIIEVNVSNSPPEEFNIVEPEDGEVFNYSENELYQDIRFIWRDAEDIDEQSLTYKLEICNQNNNSDVCWDTTLIQNEDLIVGSFCRFEIEVQKLIEDLGIIDNPNTIRWTVNAFDGFDSTVVTGVNSIFYLNFNFLEIGNELLASKYKLIGNYPNPFNPTTTLSYFIPKDEFVYINIHDSNGRLVRNLVKEQRLAGRNSVNWNATNNKGQNIAAGVYFYCIEAGNFRQTKKMILLK